MNKNLLMGIDVGTTSTKVLVTDNQGKVLASATHDYPLLFPNVGWVEQNPQDLLDAVYKGMLDVTNALKEDSSKIVAISLSTQRDTCVITDKNNKALRNAITWMDSRSSKECEELRNALGDDKVYKTTGVPISTIWTGAFFLWVKNHEKNIFDNAHCFGLVHDFVMCYLGCDKHYLDKTNACQTMMYDFSNDCWDKDILDYMEISLDKLPILVEPGTVIGTIDKNLAHELNLSEDCKLVAGGGDQQCAMLGSNCINPGDGEVSIGTAANIMVALDKIEFDNNKKLICHRSLVNNNYMIEGAMLSTGKLIEWLIDLFYSDKKDIAYQLMDNDIDINSSPGAGGLIVTPHFEGSASPHWNGDARGIALGLTLSTKRADICRAVYEGVGFEIKKNLDLIRNMNININKIVVSGGAVNSPVWLQIIADILNLDVIVLDSKQNAAIGAIILAGIGSNVFKDINEGTSKIVKVKDIYKPRVQYQDVYAKMLDLNLKLFNTLEENNIYIESLNIKHDLSKDSKQ